MKNSIYVLTDCRASARIGASLAARGFIPIVIPMRAAYDKPIAAHPDVFAFCDGNTVIADELTMRIISEQMHENDCINRKTAKTIKDTHISYPYDCSLNAAKCGNVLIGKKDILDCTLYEHAIEHGYRILDVRQGYAKCSCCVIGEKALITEDAGIAQKCALAGIDVLLLKTHEVSLAGYTYGFIGGACGLYNNTLYVVGDISKHSEYHAIKRFVDSHHVIIDSLCDGEITDVGSLLFFIAGEQQDRSACKNIYNFIK